MHGTLYVYNHCTCTVCMMQVSAKGSIKNYVVLCDTSKEANPFLSPMHTHTQVDAHGCNIASLYSTCTTNTLTRGTQESCWHSEPVLGIPQHHLLWHYHWGYRRDNSDSEAKPTWHTDHMVVILTPGTWGMCWYVIQQQWPLPPVMLLCTT